MRTLLERGTPQLRLPGPAATLPDEDAHTGRGPRSGESTPRRTRRGRITTASRSVLAPSLSRAPSGICIAGSGKTMAVATIVDPVAGLLAWWSERSCADRRRVRCRRIPTDSSVQFGLRPLRVGAGAGRGGPLLGPGPACPRNGARRLRARADGGGADPRGRRQRQRPQCRWPWSG